MSTGYTFGIHVSPERQSVRMLEIKKSRLDLGGIEHFKMCVTVWQHCTLKG